MPATRDGADLGMPRSWERRADAAAAEFLDIHARDIVSRTTADGIVLEVSSAVEPVLGYAPEDLVGRSMLDLVHAEDLPNARRHQTDLLDAHEALPVTLRARRKDGSYVWLETLAKPVRDEEGRVSEVVATSRDVTQRRLAEMAIAESERRFRATFEQAAVGFAHVSLDLRWLRVNERLCDILASPREQLLGRPFGDVIHPEDRGPEGDAADRLLRGELATHQAEFRCARKDATVVWVALTMSLVRRETGESDYFLVVLQDVSRRKRSEEALETARRELAQMEKLSALGTLVGGVAHEVRTPLAYTANHLHWMQIRLRAMGERPLSPEDLAQFERSIAEALEGVGRINSLVLDLRRFARRDRGQRVQAQLNEVVAEAVHLFRATHRGVHAVETRLDPIPPVLVDRTQVQQVLLNLMENAAEAMPRGGPIELETRTRDEYAEIAVRDRGGGIPPDVQLRVFDPFYTTKPHGMGLGLSIVHRIVEAHGGRIAFETGPGGTVFTVRFPLVQPA